MPKSPLALSGVQQQIYDEEKVSSTPTTCIAIASHTTTITNDQIYATSTALAVTLDSDIATVTPAQAAALDEGKVVKLMDFGAFVNILPGKDGLVHISQISEERVENVSDKLSEGDIVQVKVLEVDKQGRVRLSMKAVTAEAAEA